MGKKKKLVNKTGAPQYAIERVDNCLLDDIRVDFARPEVQAEFQLWLAEQEKNKKDKGCSLATLVYFWD